MDIRVRQGIVAIELHAQGEVQILTISAGLAPEVARDRIADGRREEVELREAQFHRIVHPDLVNKSGKERRIDKRKPSGQGSNFNSPVSPILTPVPKTSSLFLTPQFIFHNSNIEK